MSKKLVLAPLLAGAVVLGTAAPAFAHDCVNLSKNPSSPTVILCAQNDQVESAKPGIQQRIDNFGIDPVTGEPNFRFTGPIGIDVDCDGTADAVSYNPGQGTDGVIPAAEGSSGNNAGNCTGISNFETAMAAGCIAP